jgi:excisionase family DNA binding protein
MSHATKAPVARETLTVEQAAVALGISRSTAYTLARRGNLPTLRLGHRLVVPRVQLDRLLSGK